MNRNEIILEALKKCEDKTNKNVKQQKVVERFLTYVSYDTQSSGSSKTFPSTEKQKELGKYLEQEFKDIGFSNVIFDEFGYVYATLPASKGSEGKKALALIAHMDVSEEAPSANIHTIINEENGKVIMRTDGKTLLGADDKAGIAEIVTALEQMVGNDNFKHPELRIVITPDEEVGGGTDHIDLKKVNAASAYTIDGERLGELNYETWNGAQALIKFKGVVIHPGMAYGIMKNATLMAADFIKMLPEDETPETTKDRKGFYYVGGANCTTSDASLYCILRDFEKEGLQKKKDYVLSCVKKINEKYGEGSCVIEMEDQYPNMKEYIVPDHEELLQNVRDTYKELGIELLEVSVRGGTDGSNLSKMGLPTPNLGTGGGNCHSTSEYVCIDDMNKMVEVITKLVEKFT